MKFSGEDVGLFLILGLLWVATQVRALWHSALDFYDAMKEVD